MADLAVDALRFRHGRSAEIFAFCVMPDHVHVLLSLLRPGAALPRWVGDLKRWVSRQAQSGACRTFEWQPNFFEHVVRKSEDLSVIARYILHNPVRQSLVTRWQDYRWCGSFAWHLED